MDYAKIVEIGEWVREARIIRSRFRKKMAIHITTQAGGRQRPVAPKEKAYNASQWRHYPSPQPLAVAEISGGNAASYRGVTKSRKRFRAPISLPGGNVAKLGTFDTAELAARAYDRAAILHRGEKAKPNFPRENYA